MIYLKRYKKIFENNGDLTNIVNVLMNNKSNISTDWGIKSKEGIKNMIINNSAGDVAMALLNYNDNISTLYGKKNRIGIINIILSAYNYEDEKTIKNFNI